MKIDKITTVSSDVNAKIHQAEISNTLNREYWDFFWAILQQNGRFKRLWTQGTQFSWGKALPQPSLDWTRAANSSVLKQRRLIFRDVNFASSININCILILFFKVFFSKSGFGDCPRVQIFLQSLQDFSSTSIFFLKVHWKYKKIFLLSDLHITQVSPRAVFCSFLTFLFHGFAQVQKVIEENDEQMISWDPFWPQALLDYVKTD